MKKEFSERPGFLSKEYCAACGNMSWMDFVAGMPALVFVVTGWKSNGKPNACLQSWTSFVGAGPDDFMCVMAKVYKGGHMYQSLKETGVCALNFPSADVFDRCIKTIGNNSFDDDEITAAGLTVESCARVNAPRIAECFLNIECETLWEHELLPGSDEVTIALRAVHLCMDNDRFDQAKLGRYGETGFLYQIDQPTHPETGERSPITHGTLTPCAPIEWKTK